MILLVLSLGSCGKADFRTGGRVHLDYTDSIGYHFVRDGKPFLVRGVSGIQRLPLLKEYGGNTVRNYRLEDLCVGRSGDKGDGCNIGVIARSKAYLPFVKEKLTEEAVTEYFRHFFPKGEKPQVKR